MVQLTLQQTFDLAAQRHHAGQLPEAEELYRSVLAAQPEHAETHNNLGNVLRTMGRLDDAIASYRRAIALKPGYAKAYGNLGIALKRRGHLDDAIAAYRQAIALKPDHAEAYTNLASALRDKEQIDESIAACRQAIALNPGIAEAHSNLGSALKDKGQIDQAVAAYRQAIALKPNFADAHTNHGHALKDLGLIEEAIAAYRQSIALRPNHPEAASDVVFAQHYHPRYDAHAILEELRRWHQQHAHPLRKFIPVHSNDRDPNRRLRIGFVSPDFRFHVIGRNLLPLFQYHDRRQFEFICYAQVRRPDAMTQQFQQNADAWRGIVGLTDEQIAAQIQSDRIDILVDLALHMSGALLCLFARKPAPIQVTFGAYPGGTGLSTMDYRLTDPHLDPPGHHDDWYIEKSIRLPHSFWCYDPLPMEAPTEPVNPLPALQNGFITFGCLNNFCKLNDAVLELWAAILRRLPKSRLILLGPLGSARQRTEEKLQREQISPERIEWVSRLPRSQYLQTYRRIDLGLDTFPYNGHTTSLDSFWMGVPVVTLVGQTVVGRAGLSQLSNLGLTELIAETPRQYVEIVAALSSDLIRLSNLRQTLRRRMLDSPLCDREQFARGIEAAFRQMWRAWCDSPIVASPS